MSGVRTSDSTTSKWVLKTSSPPPRDPKLRLFCFPQAGSGAWAYQEWQKALLPESVEIIPIELPGRSTRFKEPRHTNMKDLVTALVDGISHLLQGPPFAFLGHSMGSWVAFATIQELQRRGAPLPRKLYVSAIRSPRMVGKAYESDGLQMHKLTPIQFWTAMEARYGKNPDLEGADIRAFMYPLLRDDFTLSETFSPASLDPLPCPVLVFGGASDVRYDIGMLESWGECTAPGTCYVRLLPGGHNFLFRDNESKTEFFAILKQDVQRVIDGDTAVPPNGHAEWGGSDGMPHTHEHATSSVHSTASDAGATVTSTMSYMTGSKATAPTMGGMTQGGGGVGSGSEGDPGSPMANASQEEPSKGCFQRLIQSWKR